MLVQTEGIVTQLVFQHALRIRMKAETGSTQSSSPASASTPDIQSIVDNSTDNEDEIGSIVQSEGSLRESSSSSTAVATSTNKGKQQDIRSVPKAPEVKEEEKKDNLIGKINNLVTTDLGNLVGVVISYSLVCFGSQRSAISQLHLLL